MKLNIMSPVVASIMILLSLSPQIVFADTPMLKDSVKISVTGMVEAETCKLIEAEMPEVDIDMGTLPLKELQEMRDGNKVYGQIRVNRKISFTCDGSAKKVDFTFKSDAPSCPISAKGLNTSKYLCNEAENGATVALAYDINWKDPTGENKREVLWGDSNMNTVYSGMIDNGKFDFQLPVIFYAPYKSHPTVSPGEIKGSVLVTVWNP
ncbi:fimbrial protein [Aeromonas bestiarum]|uniref:fimbrial protein n=1 Tax=Aeromonas bestiarum TaxID=105751 RepID=UPI00104086B8|nr:hypothetical protein [Aeromonas bestiarum]